MFDIIITDTIEKLLTEWVATPIEINSGLCDYFAMEIQERVPYAKEECSEIYNAPVGHVWVSYKGRHYDAQAPDGVSDWSQLPIFLSNDQG